MLYDINKLNNLRFYSKVYFHGHSVGGTNPSLLEAMSSGAFICAHKNIFNEAILETDAHYFTTEDEVAEVVATVDKNHSSIVSKVSNNLLKINKLYLWPTIIDKYIEHFEMIWVNSKSTITENSLRLRNQQLIQ